MVYKIFNEEGDYIITSTGERVNILFAPNAWTPEGLNVGWTEYTLEDEVLQQLGIEYSQLI